MKQIVQPRNAILREVKTFKLKPSPIRNTKLSSKENAPPSDPNSMAADSKPSRPKLKIPLPPRHPSSNPLKRKLRIEPILENSIPGISDSGVKVIVRMRPPYKDGDEGENIVHKVADDSLSINGQTFTFDSVTSTDATQLDIFELLGEPLVENCMAGFNSSIFAYGQTGSGKTYTMWGPANALLDNDLFSSQKGITPRVFERLFARIDEEQVKHTDKLLKYQCCCSFLEIYNEQITDLLDPNQRNLQIREDVKSGVYIENLTEKCVSTMADVTQLLMKGLANRRTGATSINSESSRSHTVFTCVVESRSKKMGDGLCSFKTSRINLVDLAGSERQKLAGTAGERLKEAGNINRSLSQLGNLINILAEISQTGKQRHIPYRDSRLTFLLQESLGGNSKLAMICAISPAKSCKSETISTLRFAQRAKSIKNKAIVNEVTQDDVKHLREVIRQLRDEVHRLKSNGTGSNDTNGGHSTAWIRRSLKVLRSSISRRPITLPRVDDDDEDEEMEIDEEAVENLCNQLDEQYSGFDASEASEANIVKSSSIVASVGSGFTESPLCASGSERLKKNSEDIDVIMREDTCVQDEVMVAGSIQPVENTPECAGVLKYNDHRAENQIITNSKVNFPQNKIDVGMDLSCGDKENSENPVLYMCSSCKIKKQLMLREPNDSSDLQIVPVEAATDKILDGAFGRETTLEEYCNKEALDISELDHLVKQYKDDKRECKIILPTEEEHEEHMAGTEMKRIQEELEIYRNFYDMGERDMLLEEIQNLKSQLKYQNSLLQFQSQQKEEC